MVKFKNTSFDGCDIHQLSDYFQCLLSIEKNYKKLTDNEKTQIEQHKLAIMQAVLLLLRSSKDITKLTAPKKSSVQKTIFIWASALFNPFFSSIGGFNLSNNILMLIPGMLSPLSVTLGVMCGVMNAFFNIGLGVGKFKKTLGISTLRLRPIVHLFKEQLKTANDIRSTLLSAQCSLRCSANDYIFFQKVTSLFDQDIQHKNDQIIKCYEESPLFKKIKWSIGILNTILSASAGFLMTDGLLTLLGGACLLSTPIGWAIGGLLAVFSAASFFYLHRKDMYGVLDKIAGCPKKLALKLGRFVKNKPQFEEEMHAILHAKKTKEAEVEQLQNKVMVSHCKNMGDNHQGALKQNSLVPPVSITTNSIFKLNDCSISKNDFALSADTQLLRISNT